LSLSFSLSFSLSLSLSLGVGAQGVVDSTWFVPLDRCAQPAATVLPAAAFPWEADTGRHGQIDAWFDGSAARVGKGSDAVVGLRGVGMVRGAAAGQRWGAVGTAEVWRWGSAAPEREEGRVVGIGRAWVRESGATEALRFTGRAWVTLSPSVVLEAGVHPQHWGAGWRSVWLDRAAESLPYVRASIGKERVRYSHLVARTPRTDGASWLAAHTVDVDLGAGFTGSLFGAVRWLEADSGYRFRFDPGYAVPFVAFRPVEYAGGSADNALIGAALRWSRAGWTLYAQAAVDEFLFREVADRSGWWGTKYAALVHAARTGPRGGVLAEAVVVRPYTFSHVHPGTSWSHHGAPLGHPAGANFAEIRAVGERRWGALRARCGVVHRLGGDGPRIGSDVAETYLDRPANYGIGTVWIGGGAVPEARWARTWWITAEVARTLERLGGSEAFVRAVAGTASVVEAGIRTDRVMGDRTW
jgi:hypothetical protein